MVLAELQSVALGQGRALALDRIALIIKEREMHVPRKDENGKRSYGQWAGNPKGWPEDQQRCIAEVSAPSGWTFVQCSRKRGHGPSGAFCKQHANKAIE